MDYEGSILDTRPQFHVHGSGQTSRQMKTAPMGAVFVWCGYDLSYPKSLAHALGRTDLVVVKPTWFSMEEWGDNVRHVVIDHATELTTAQKRGYQAFRIHMRAKYVRDTTRHEWRVDTIPAQLNQVRGKFWMIQSDRVAPESKKDKFGRFTLDWPGRSIYNTKKEALEGAKALAKMHPEISFFVMEAVQTVSVKEPEYEVTKL